MGDAVPDAMTQKAAVDQAIAAALPGIVSAVAERMRPRNGTDELEVTGPKGLNFRARGAHVVLVVAVLVAGCAIGGGTYFGMKHGLAPMAADQAQQTATIVVGLPQLKQEHETIAAEVRGLRQSSLRRECIELLDNVEKKNLRANYSPGAMKTFCPWLVE